MPTHEDIFLLKLIMEQGLISPQAIHNPLCQFYQYESKGKYTSLAIILDRTNLITRNQLQNLQNQIHQILANIAPTAKTLVKISEEECIRSHILRQNARGTSYVAKHPVVGSCVVKCIEGIIAKNKPLLRRLMTTIERTKNIQNSYWGNVYAVDLLKGIIVRQFILGETLEIRLLQGPLSVDSASSLIYYITNGLQVAYQQGILHKNLKLSNIIITEQGKAVVVDGGLPPSIPQYFSPEQCQKKKADVRSDIYALGLIYYQMLTGLPPYTGTTIKEIERSLSIPIPSLQESHPEIPEEICNMVHKMMQFNPEERYQNYSELLMELNNLLDIRPEPEITEAGEQPVPCNDEVCDADQNTVGQGESSGNLAVESAESSETVTAEPIPESSFNKRYQESTNTNPPPPPPTINQPPSVDVIVHRRARRLAEDIVSNLQKTFEKEIREACLHDNFYENIKTYIALARKQFQNKMKSVSSVSIENMPYIEEAFEKIRKQITSEIQAQGITAEPVGRKHDDFMEPVSVRETNIEPDDALLDAGLDPIPADAEDNTNTFSGEQTGHTEESSVPDLPDESDFAINFGTHSTLHKPETRVRSLADVKGAGSIETKHKPFSGFTPKEEMPNAHSPSVESSARQENQADQSSTTSNTANNGISAVFSPSSEPKLKPFFATKSNPTAKPTPDESSVKPKTSSIPTITNSNTTPAESASVNPVTQFPNTTPTEARSSTLAPDTNSATESVEGISDEPKLKPFFKKKTSAIPKTTSLPTVSESSAFKNDDSPLDPIPQQVVQTDPVSNISPTPNIAQTDSNSNISPTPNIAVGVFTPNTSESNVVSIEEIKSTPPVNPIATDATNSELAKTLGDIIKAPKLSRPAFFAGKFAPLPKKADTPTIVPQSLPKPAVSELSEPSLPAKLVERLEIVRLSEKAEMMKRNTSDQINQNSSPQSAREAKQSDSTEISNESEEGLKN